MRVELRNRLAQIRRLSAVYRESRLRLHPEASRDIGAVVGSALENADIKVRKEGPFVLP
jgi:hypothetical protein